MPELSTTNKSLVERPPSTSYLSQMGMKHPATDLLLASEVSQPSEFEKIITLVPREALVLGGTGRPPAVKMASQPTSINSLPNELLQQIFRHFLLIDACYEEEESAATSPEEVRAEAARTAKLIFRSEGQNDFLKTQFMFDSWQKKDHISAHRRRTAVLSTNLLAVSPHWLEVGKDILLHDNGFVEISTNDADFWHKPRGFGLQMWTLSPHSSRPDPIVKLEIRPNDDENCKRHISPALKYTHLVHIEDIDQLGRFLMCQQVNSTHLETNVIEYLGRCFRIHIDRVDHKFISRKRDPFEALIFSPFAAGLMGSISAITVSPNCRSQAKTGSQLAVFQMSSTFCEIEPNHDLLGPAYLLSRLADQYDVVRKDNTHHRAEGVLLRILEFTSSMLGCKIDKKDLDLSPTDSRRRALSYLTEVTRVAAYRLARIMMQLVVKPSGPAIFRIECAWKAIRLLQYAFLIPAAYVASQNRWKALCCFQLMRVYGIVSVFQPQGGSINHSLDFFAKALNYAESVCVDGMFREKVLVVQDARAFRDEYLQSNVNGNARWRTSWMFREAFFHALAKTINVPLLATCWSDADEAVFPDRRDFFEN